MESAIVSHQDELDMHVEAFAKRGMKLAAVSNTGLPPGQIRITFLPESAFDTEAMTDIAALAARDKIVARLFTWFTQQNPDPFEIEDFQAICLDLGLMTDYHDFTPLGEEVFGFDRQKTKAKPPVES